MTAEAMAGAPALRPGGPAVAYDAAHLDDQIKKYVGVAEKNLRLLEDMGEPLADRIRTEIASLDAESTSIIYDRLVKAGLNLVKALDELSRLRSFMSGGPDTRPDLSSLGEVELRGIVVAAVKALGADDIRKLLGEGA